MKSAKERSEERRRRMTVRRVDLHAPDAETAVTGSDAVLLAAKLSREAWVLSRQPYPRLDRKNYPISTRGRRETNDGA